MQNFVVLLMTLKCYFQRNERLNSGEFWGELNVDNSGLMQNKY